MACRFGLGLSPRKSSMGAGFRAENPVHQQVKFRHRGEALCGIIAGDRRFAPLPPSHEPCRLGVRGERETDDAAAGTRPQQSLYCWGFQIHNCRQFGFHH
ncbi:hypothetical protein BaRGS_00018527 [Batillaria attramentaria]|uniref:Uncharacterized protein n=1 Tax=Batillaria attramentaria TaxID=370345 RepID=A0ABD0KTS1_9CAEN